MVFHLDIYIYCGWIHYICSHLAVLSLLFTYRCYFRVLYMLFSILGSFAKFRKATIRFVMSVCRPVCPHWTTRLPMDGFSWNLIF